jgi:hypothetical protein
MIAFLADYTDNSAVYYEHCTGSARRHAAVKCCARNGNAAFGCLADGVLFGVDCADAVRCDIAVIVQHFFKQVPCIIAMR